MYDLTTFLTLKNRIDWQKNGKKNGPIKLGLIFTGEYPGLNEHLVEEEIIKYFDINNLEEIITVGKREKTFKYANRFAKKFNISITAKRLEHYLWEDIDNDIKRNTLGIIGSCDSVIIFHGDSSKNVVAWFALSSARRIIALRGECVFVSSIPKPTFSGLEKEIFDVLQIQNDDFRMDSFLMEERFFELMSEKRSKFVKYVQIGENMSFKQILFKLSEICMERKDCDFDDGFDHVSRIIMNFLLYLICKDIEDENGFLKTEYVDSYIKSEINPNYYDRISCKAEDVCFVMIYHDWYEFEYLLDVVNYFEDKEDEESCAALCFGKWLTLLQAKGYETEKIIKKYKIIE